jgi:hypothetical protein
VNAHLAARAACAQRATAPGRLLRSAAVLPQLAGGLLVAAFGAMESLRQGKAAKSVRWTATDRGTSVLIIAAYALAVLAIASHVLPSVELTAMVAWVGVGIGALGLAFRIWAMRVLGRFYTRRLVTTRDQRVVRDGPYRRVPSRLSRLDARLDWGGDVLWQPLRVRLHGDARRWPKRREMWCPW